VPRAGAANNQLVYLKQEIYMDFVWVQTCTVYDCHSQGATENYLVKLKTMQIRTTRINNPI